MGHFLCHWLPLVVSKTSWEAPSATDITEHCPVLCWKSLHLYLEAPMYDHGNWNGWAVASIASKFNLCLCFGQGIKHQGMLTKGLEVTINPVIDCIQLRPGHCVKKHKKRGRNKKGKACSICTEDCNQKETDVVISARERLQEIILIYKG